MTAVGILDQQGRALPEMSRFEDGMVDMRELIRTMTESLVNEIMHAQTEDACADGNRRNDYRERSLLTSVGEIRLRIPKLRVGTYFPEDLVERYSRVDRAVVAWDSDRFQGLRRGPRRSSGGPYTNFPDTNHDSCLYLSTVLFCFRPI